MRPILGKQALARCTTYYLGLAVVTDSIWHMCTHATVKTTLSKILQDLTPATVCYIFTVADHTKQVVNMDLLGLVSCIWIHLKIKNTKKNLSISVILCSCDLQMSTERLWSIICLYSTLTKLLSGPAWCIHWHDPTHISK